MGIVHEYGGTVRGPGWLESPGRRASQSGKQRRFLEAECEPDGEGAHTVSRLWVPTNGVESCTHQHTHRGPAAGESACVEDAHVAVGACP